MEELGGGGTGKQTELGHIGCLIGFSGDAQCEEFDTLVLGISDSRENIRIPRAENAICKQQCYFDAVRIGLLQVNPGYVGDGVGSEGTMPNVNDGSYTGLEILCTPPVFEGLLCDDMTTVLQQSHPKTQAAASVQLYALKSLHHVHNKLFLLLVIIPCTLRAVQEEGELQAAVLV